MQKNEVFACIRERVWKKAKGWKAVWLSRAGKEVLIKLIAQSMQAYAMNVFLLPITVSDEIKMTLNAFWWCDDERRIKLSS